MGFSYQELKSIKKKSIILEKQENLEIQQNSTKFRQRKRTLTKERFYEERQPSKEKTRSNVNLTKQSDGCTKTVLDSLKSGKEQQQVVIEKVLDTSQQLSHLEETINHEIQKLKQQRSLLKGDRDKMERKRNKKPANEVKEPTTWAEYLEDNNSRERQGNPREISKEKFSLQHKCICTSPRYGSDKNVSARPRMRSVASQIQTLENYLDQGAVGDHVSAINLKPLKKEILQGQDSQIPKQNDQIVYCCYGLTCPATCQQSLTTTAATNSENCRHYSYQHNGIDRNREYNYCRDEYYYNIPNCSCNNECRSRSKTHYRRQSTDLNTQDFYYRSPEKSANKSHKSRSNSKTKKKTKPFKTKESQELNNENKKRECFEKKEKQQRNKSAEQRSCKSGKHSQLLSEESALKLIKYLDRYVDDYEKEFNLRGNKSHETKQNSEDSSATQTVKIKSHTKLCQVTVRKKQQEPKLLQDFKDCGGDSNSLDTQYSWETLSMLKKMTIREYKPLKAKEKSDLAKSKTANELEIKNKEKMERYRKYLNKYEQEQKSKKALQVLKSPPENFSEPDSEEVEIFKQKARNSREATNSDNFEHFRERKINSSLINKAKFSSDLGEEKTFPASNSYEELICDYGPAARAADSWLDCKKYRDQERSRQAKYDHEEQKGDKYYQEEKRRAIASMQDDIDIFRESRVRDPNAEDQESKIADKQKDKSICRESRDRERITKDPRAKQAATPNTNLEISRPDSLAEETDFYRQNRNREREVKKDPLVKSNTNFEISRQTVNRERKAKEDPSVKYDEDVRRNVRERTLEGEKFEPEYDDETRRQSLARQRKSQEQSSRYYEDGSRYSKEAKQHLIECLNLTPKRVAGENDDETFRKSQDRRRKSQDQSSSYYENDTNQQHPIENLNLSALECSVKAEAEYDDRIYRQSREKERKSQDFRRRDLREADVERKFHEESLRESSGIPRKVDDQLSRYFEDTRKDSRDQSHKYYEDLRRDSVRERKYPRELLNYREDVAEYDEVTFRESGTKPQKERTRCFEDKRKDFEDPSSKNQEDSRKDSTDSELLNKREYCAEYEEAFGKETKNIDFPKPRDKYYKDHDSYKDRPSQNQQNYVAKSYRDFENAKRDSNRYSEENRAIRAQQLESKENFNDPVRDTEIKHQYRSQNDSQEPHKSQSQDLEEIKVKPEHFQKSSRQQKRSTAERFSSKMAEERGSPTRSSFVKKETQESSRHQKRSTTEPFSSNMTEERGSPTRASFVKEETHESSRHQKRSTAEPLSSNLTEERGSPIRFSFAKKETQEYPRSSFVKKETQEYPRSSFVKKETQESPRFPGYVIDSKEPRTSTSYRKEYQEYPLKQEQQMPESFPKQNEQFGNEPKSQHGEELKVMPRKSNSSSYDDFKQVMDQSLGLYTSRASQTDYHMIPEISQQLSSQTFTRENETLMEYQASKVNPEAESKQHDLPIDHNSPIPITTSDALKYLKNFLETYQETVLEGECVKAVTCAANELITKLSSCKSSLQNASNTRMIVKDEGSFSVEDKASLILEQKLTQDTQYKDLESTTDSSDPQLSKTLVKEEDSKNLAAESHKSEMEALQNSDVEEHVKEEPLMELLEHESYHYQSQPSDVQTNWETTETYQRYEEYKENLADLRTQKEITDEQEFLHQRHSTNAPENNDQLSLSYVENFIEPSMERECIYRSLPSGSRLKAFDPQLMPLKGILKPCRVMEDQQTSCYDLESHRTTSVVSFGSREQIDINRDTTMICKLGEEERAQHYNETQQTIITKDESLQPITQQTKYHLTESSTSKQPIYQYNQLDSLSALEPHSRNDCPHLYTVELEKFKQCPCMLDTYMTMLNNYYKGKKN